MHKSCSNLSLSWKSETSDSITSIGKEAALPESRPCEDISPPVLLGRLHAVLSFRQKLSGPNDGLLDRPVSMEELEQMLRVTLGWERSSEKAQIVMKSLGIKKSGRVHLLDALERHANMPYDDENRRSSKGLRSSSKVSSRSGSKRSTLRFGSGNAKITSMPAISGSLSAAQSLAASPVTTSRGRPSGSSSVTPRRSTGKDAWSEADGLNSTAGSGTLRHRLMEALRVVDQHLEFEEEEEGSGRRTARLEEGGASAAQEGGGRRTARLELPSGSAPSASAPPEWLLRTACELSSESTRTRREAVQKLLDRMEKARPHAMFFAGSLALVLKKDPESDLRAGAARALGEVATELAGQAASCAETLAAAVRADMDLATRCAAMQALGALGVETAACFAEDLYVAATSDPEREARQTAAEVLGSFGGETADHYAERLAEEVSDGKDRVTRLRAVQALAAFGPAAEPYAGSLRSASLHDCVAGVRAAAASSLNQLREAGAEQVKCMLDELKEGDKNSRRAAATALGFIVDAPQVSGLLDAALEDDDVVVRWRAAQALGSLGSTAALEVEQLVATALGMTEAEWEESKKPAPPARVKRDSIVVTALGAAPLGAGRRRLSSMQQAEEVTEDLVDVKQSRAIEALAALGDAAVPHLDKLVAVLVSKGSPAKRQGAAQALATLCAPGSTHSTKLVAALRDRDATVRRHAATAVGGLREEGVAHADGLVDMLGDGNQQVRKAALSALGKLGKEAAPLMDAHLQSRGLEDVAPRASSKYMVTVKDL